MSHSPPSSLPTSLSSAFTWTLSRLTSHTSPVPSTSKPPHSPPASRPRTPFTLPPLSPLHLSAPNQTLTRPLAEEIRQLLPARLQLHDHWTLTYSLERDGVSLNTLYTLAAARPSAGHVLVVRDTNNCVFGAFINEAPRPSGGRYYGTGECFLWKATERGFRAFPYSGVNEYMMLCDDQFLSVGGGDGRYGLWLDDSLDRGVTARCPTFGNEVLSDAPGGKFEILDVELWRIGS